MTDGHGDDLWRYGDKVNFNFSSNIHSAFDHAPLMSLLSESMDAVTDYPEPEPFSVEAALASKFGCAPEEVMVANGATEAIYLIARLMQGEKSAIVSPTFREYQDACVLAGHSISFISGLDSIPSHCGCVWLCNPNNPTGKVTPIEELRATIETNQDKIFVIDQAYSDYTSCPTLSSGEVIRCGNAIMLGSLTKRFAIPGLRIGYAVGNRDIIIRLKRLRMPWSVNGFAIKGALFLLDNIENYPISAEKLHDEALRITREFKGMGINVIPTDCNFILCRLPKGTAACLKRFLVDEAGILIRDASNFEGLDASYFRVAAQTPDENDLLIKHIKKWLDI